jgi:hypothetical protein
VTRSAVNLVQAELRPPAVRLVFVVSDLALLAWHCERSQVVIAHNAGRDYRGGFRWLLRVRRVHATACGAGTGSGRVKALGQAVQPEPAAARSLLACAAAALTACAIFLPVR